MTDSPRLDRPWLIAAWPGMGHVALSAGYYLISKLDMNQFAELSADELFELKSELDRLGVFAQYEDRFLDLFKTQ